jgi:peroxiredoxin Q/BCP
MYKMVLRLDVGSHAEDFTLSDYRGNAVSLSDLMGKGIVFFTFFRGGFDRESVKFLQALKENYPKIRDAGCEVLAITPELPQKAAAVVNDLQLPFGVACDTDMKATKMYDVYNPAMNWCWPAGFILDRNGVIQYSFRGASPPNTPPVEYIVRKIEQMKKAEEQAAPTKSVA